LNPQAAFAAGASGWPKKQLKANKQRNRNAAKL